MTLGTMWWLLPPHLPIPLPVGHLLHRFLQMLCRNSVILDWLSQCMGTHIPHRPPCQYPNTESSDGLYIETSTLADLLQGSVTVLPSLASECPRNRLHHPLSRSLLQRTKNLNHFHCRQLVVWVMETDFFPHLPWAILFTGPNKHCHFFLKP